MIMRETICAIILTAAIICTAESHAQQTKRLTADKHNEYGLIYYLPTTALEISVTATHEVRKAGPYYQYAKKYLGTDKVITSDSEHWTITSIEIQPYGVPDKENEYLMQLKAGALTFLCVDTNGMLLSINTESLPPYHLLEKREELPVSSLDNNQFLQYVNEDFLNSQSSAKRAQLLAQDIMDIRESKVALTRGTAETMPTDGHQLELMLNSLEKQEKSMVDAFIGTTSSHSITKVFTYIPSPDENGRKVLFRLSDFAGFVDVDDYSGDPVYINIEITQHGSMPVNDKGEEKMMPKDAIAYCIPGIAKVTIIANNNILFSKETEFSQFGTVFGLNPSLFTSKKEPSFAIFNSATGAIQQLGSEVITQ